MGLTRIYITVTESLTLTDHTHNHWRTHERVKISDVTTHSRRLSGCHWVGLRGRYHLAPPEAFGLLRRSSSVSAVVMPKTPYLRPPAPPTLQSKRIHVNLPISWSEFEQINNCREFWTCLPIPVVEECMSTHRYNIQCLVIIHTFQELLQQVLVLHPK